MKNIFFDNTETLSIENQRGAHLIKKTKTGISVKTMSVYSDRHTTICYYKDYPKIPNNWESEINEYGTTEREYFLLQLQNYEPFRIIR